jgi:hypothetical protein
MADKDIDKISCQPHKQTPQQTQNNYSTQQQITEHKGKVIGRKKGLRDKHSREQIKRQAMHCIV